LARMEVEVEVEVRMWGNDNDVRCRTYVAIPPPFRSRRSRPSYSPIQVTNDETKLFTFGRKENVECG